MVRKLIFLSFIINTLIGCKIFHYDVYNSHINVKKELENELNVFINYLDSIKGHDNKRVIYVIKYKRNDAVFYTLQNSHKIAVNLTAFFSYPDSQFLIEKEVPWNGYKFIKGTLVCLYNNEDLENVKHCGLDIGNYPISFLVDRFYNKSDIAFENEEETDIIVTFLKPKRKINHFCIYETNFDDSLYLKYRKNKLHKSVVCKDNSLLY